VFPQFVGMRVITRCNGNEEEIKSRKNSANKKALSESAPLFCRIDK
jgi:hypothetical protein